MDFREIGNRIGAEAIEEQIVQGKKFNEDLNGALPDEAQGTALQRLMAKIFGTAIAEHTVGYGGRVAVAPNLEPGLALDELCVVMQVNEAGEFVELWAKIGPLPTDWRSFGFGSPDQDRLVAADSSDTAPGTMAAKSAAGVGVEQEVKVFDGVRKLETRSTGLAAVRAGDVPAALESRLDVRAPLTKSIEGTVADRKMYLGIKLPDPEVEGKYLYTARIKDPLDFGQVVCCYLGPHAPGGNNPMFAGWEQPEPGVFVRTETGAIPPAWLDGVNTQADDADLKAPSPLLNKLFLAYYQGDTSELGTEEPLQQLLILEDAGAHWEPTPGHPETLMLVNTHARFRRAPGFTDSSQYVQGMTFQAQTGNLYGAGFFALTNSSVNLGTTALAWDYSPGPTYDWSYGYELLSSTQLTTENVDTANVDASVTTASGAPGVAATAYLEDAFMTLPGTPGISKLPAGPQEFHFEQVSLYTSDVTGVTKLRVRLIITDAAGDVSIVDLDPMVEATITPNVTVENLVIPYRLPADIAMTSVQRFVFSIGISTTCQTPATLTVRTNSVTHGTYWKGTFQLPAGGGTNSHPDLMGRDLENQHPRYSMTDAIGMAIITGADTLTRLALAAPYRSGEITLTNNVVLYGIDPTGWSDGQVLELFVDGLKAETASAVLTLVHMNTPDPDDGSAIYVGVDPETGSGQNAPYVRPVSLRFKRRARLNRWQLLEARM